ncbi:symporter small accessory protein [Methanoculleus caldifontis]
MLGITDPSIWVAYVLAIGLTLACILYGLLNWNKGLDDSHGS